MRVKKKQKLCYQEIIHSKFNTLNIILRVFTKISLGLAIRSPHKHVRYQSLHR
jgi:hypothetical protein